MGERKTITMMLEDAVGLACEPVKLFVRLVDESSTGELESALLVLRTLLEKQKADFEKIYEVINRTIGRINIESPVYGEVVKAGGRNFKHPDFIRAMVEPKPQAAPEGGV
jgi:hypothetical protein